MFETPRRGRQARNFTTNVPKILDLKSSSEQIFSRKLSLGAPEKMTTVGRVIGLKGMPITKRLWGHFSNLDTTETPEENVKIVPICLILSINPTKRSSIEGNLGNQASSARSFG